MHIVHAIATLDPAAGGPPRVAARLAAAQARLGHQVTLLSHAPAADRQAIVDRAIAEVPGSAVLSRVTLSRDSISMLGRVKGSVLSQIPRGDVFHLHGVWDPILLASSRVARDRGAAFVVRPAGMLDPWSMKQSSFKKRIALMLGWKGMLDAALFIHALNRDEAELMRPVGAKSPVEVIPNGIFLEEVGELPVPGGFRSRHTELGSDPFVYFMSRLHHKKGLDILADGFAIVAKTLPNARLVVAGPDEGAEGAFREQVARLGIKDRVHIVGPLYGRDKIAALVDAAVFCLPSRQEGFSVAVTEALACGCPAVVSRDCHFPEVAEAGAGRVVDLDAAAVSTALVEILRDPRLARRLGDAGRNLVLTRFTWPEIAKQTIACYERRATSLPGLRRATST